MSLTKVAIVVGSSKFWAVTELIDNRGCTSALSILMRGNMSESQEEREL
jgi:hypothetical protein